MDASETSELVISCNYVICRKFLIRCAILPGLLSLHSKSKHYLSRCRIEAVDAGHQNLEWMGVEGMTIEDNGATLATLFTLKS